MILSVHFDIPSVFILDMVEALNFLHPSLPFFIRHPGRLNGQTRTLEFHGHLLRLYNQIKMKDEDQEKTSFVTS